MGIQPSLFKINTQGFCRLLAAQRPMALLNCPRLNPNGTLNDQACWETFIGQSGACCAICAPFSDDELSVKTRDGEPPIVSDAHGLAKHMYPWARIHWDDEFSWTRATVLENSFWQHWAVLTTRTMHLTSDVDWRGLCGFLTTEELPGFVDQLKTIHLPSKEDWGDELDLFQSEEEFASLQQIISYSENCISDNQGLAWVHDFLH